MRRLKSSEYTVRGGKLVPVTPAGKLRAQRKASQERAKQIAAKRAAQSLFVKGRPRRNINDVPRPQPASEENERAFSVGLFLMELRGHHPKLDRDASQRIGEKFGLFDREIEQNVALFGELVSIFRSEIDSDPKTRSVHKICKRLGITEAMARSFLKALGYHVLQTSVYPYREKK